MAQLPIITLTSLVTIKEFFTLKIKTQYHYYYFIFLKNLTPVQRNNFTFLLSFQQKLHLLSLSSIDKTEKYGFFSTRVSPEKKLLVEFKHLPFVL
jgi:hypothetical protein